MVHDTSEKGTLPPTRNRCHCVELLTFTQRFVGCALPELIQAVSMRFMRGEVAVWTRPHTSSLDPLDRAEKSEALASGSKIGSKMRTVCRARRFCAASNAKRRRVGFVGLGVMGGPMALQVLEAGFNLSVYDSSTDATR